MAELPNLFDRFLKDIRLTSTQTKEAQTGHKTLRQRLLDYADLKDIIVNTFLQGSYRRATAVRPASGKRSDVDVVVVTNLKEDDYDPPSLALEVFRPFVKEHYRGKYRFQGRSIGIELSYVDLDLVITSAPSEAAKNLLSFESVLTSDTIEESAGWKLHPSWLGLKHRSQWNYDAALHKASQEEEWKTEPLRIPDREAEEWQVTNPLEQIRWTWQKNADTNKYFVNVVKAIKWWQRVHYPDSRPKGYPLEHIIGDCCPDAISSIAVGVTETLERIRDDFQSDVDARRVPCPCDRGVEQNVFKRITSEQFEQFHTEVTEAASAAREALEEKNQATSATLWRELFGNRFPEPGGGKGSEDGGSGLLGGFSSRSDVSQLEDGRFA